ncbi:hypothetical protein N0V90_011268 [Kalmusia sp. IMI 367209]|nr:hypothetical protein N0V90_011268 [Kalmusia sp. IMI 367209]
MAQDIEADFKTTTASLDELEHGSGRVEKAAPGVPPERSAGGQWHGLEVPWAFACAGSPSILANMITSLAIFNNDNYVPARWHTSLIMIATMIVPVYCESVVPEAD